MDDEAVILDWEYAVLFFHFMAPVLFSPPASLTKLCSRGRITRLSFLFDLDDLVGLKEKKKKKSCMMRYTCISFTAKVM